MQEPPTKMWIKRRTEKCKYIYWLLTLQRCSPYPYSFFKGVSDNKQGKKKKKKVISNNAEYREELLKTVYTESDECNNGGELFLDIYIRKSITQK